MGNEKDCRICICIIVFKKTDAAYDWSVETTIYVDKDVKQQGIGKKLYEALEEILRKQHVINLDACITDPEIEDEYVTKKQCSVS